MTQEDNNDVYLYRFVVCNPVQEVIDALPDLGVQLIKEQQGVFYLCSSFISHKQAEFIARKTGIQATSFKRIPMDKKGDK